jgi:mRNA-degrading endonuclease RelE of RelBE toxin-antitoxin system
MTNEGEWTVQIHRHVQKTYRQLPERVRKELSTLLFEIRYKGPIQGNWKNYSKLNKNQHHCHIKGGHPTYVCCWREIPNLRKVEVYYLGTHENAPY